MEPYQFSKHIEMAYCMQKIIFRLLPFPHNVDCNCGKIRIRIDVDLARINKIPPFESNLYGRWRARNGIIMEAA